MADEMGTETGETPRNFELLLDIPLEVTVEIGRTRLPLRTLLQLGAGSVIELAKLAGEPLDVLVNGKPSASSSGSRATRSRWWRVSAARAAAPRTAESRRELPRDLAPDRRRARLDVGPDRRAAHAALAGAGDPDHAHRLRAHRDRALLPPPGGRYAEHAAEPGDRVARAVPHLFRDAADAARDAGEGAGALAARRDRRHRGARARLRPAPPLHAPPDAREG